jgi:hypothetical protein
MYVRYAHQLLSSIALDIQVVSTGKLFDFPRLDDQETQSPQFPFGLRTDSRFDQSAVPPLSILVGKFRNLLRQDAKP